MLSPRRLRRYAACVLLVWLFGLASGIVNACIVSAELRRADAVASLSDHEHAAMPEGTVATLDHEMAGHDHGGTTAPPACERLCDAPPAAPQADKPSPHQPLSAFWLAPAPLPAVAVRQAPRLAEPVPSQAPRWAGTIPISIAFLRLAL